MRGHARSAPPFGAGMALAIALVVGPPVYFFQTSGSLIYTAIGTALCVAVYAVAGMLLAV